MADDTSIAVMERPTLRGWDYAVITVHARHNDLLEGALKERGRDGWELSFITMPFPNEYQCVFRRPQ